MTADQIVMMGRTSLIALVIAVILILLTMLITIIILIRITIINIVIITTINDGAGFQGAIPTSFLVLAELLVVSNNPAGSSS